MPTGYDFPTRFIQQRFGFFKRLKFLFTGSVWMAVEYGSNGSAQGVKVGLDKPAGIVRVGEAAAAELNDRGTLARSAAAAKKLARSKGGRKGRK